MILGIKKKNFFLYLIIFSIGIICVIFSYICENQNSTILKDILSGLGWGFVPTSITAFLFDRINIQNENKRKKDLRTYFLNGLVFNTTFLVKNIINEFYEGDDIDDSIYNICKKIIYEYVDLKLKNKTIEIETSENRESKERIITQILSCKEKACEIEKDISNLMIDEILDENEIANIRSFIMSCNEISIDSPLIEIIDKLDEILSCLYSIKEIGNIFNKQVKIRNHKVKDINTILK